MACGPQGTARTTIVAVSGSFQRAEKLARFANAFEVFSRVSGSCRGSRECEYGWARWRIARGGVNQPSVSPPSTWITRPVM